MEERVDQRLFGKDVEKSEQLQAAIDRQQLYGGKIGQNLVTLGYVKEEELTDFFKFFPHPPKTVEDTGLKADYLADLILKHLLQPKKMSLLVMVDKLKLPPSVVNKVLDILRQRRCVEITRGNAVFSEGAYEYSITERGFQRAIDQMEVCRYVGPAPVMLEDYKFAVDAQTAKNIDVNDEMVNEAFSKLVVDKDVLKGIGAAVSSGKPIFLYGPPGNGKTSFAETIGGLLPGDVFIPYAILVSGEIIVVYDEVNHTAVESETDYRRTDQRWIKIRRPVVLAGGELTLKALDLNFNPMNKFYEAPLQLKSNNGLFIVDDFGRQQVDPQILLNRWIVPLDRRNDYLTLHTGMKFEIPFDQLVIFATNIEPKSLVDDAFLRRLRYKMKVDFPTKDEYVEIFRRVCESNDIRFEKRMLNYLIENYYVKYGAPFNACQPRDIVDHIIDEAHYRKRAPALTEEALDYAWKKYFVEM